MDYQRQFFRDNPDRNRTRNRLLVGLAFYWGRPIVCRFFYDPRLVIHRSEFVRVHGVPWSYVLSLSLAPEGCSLLLNKPP